MSNEKTKRAAGSSEPACSVLLITQCKDQMRWYRDKIRQTVPFLGDVGTEYKSREDAGYINFVQYEDAEIITPNRGG